MSEKSIGVCEIYPAVQGEGKSVGRPSLFVRLWGCNLQCGMQNDDPTDPAYGTMGFICDTPYTWHVKESKNEGLKRIPLSVRANEYRRISVSQFVEELNIKMRETRIRRLVITGGEPLLWTDALYEAFSSNDWEGGKPYWVEIETNGTISPGKLDPYINQYNVSAKLANSGNPKAKREDFLALSFFAQSLYTEFKFVVADDKDFDEILDLIKRYRIPLHRVWIMAEGKTREEQDSRAKWIIDKALQYGFNVSPRLHVMIYGSKRGV